MNTTVHLEPTPDSDHRNVLRHIDAACDRIAPTWPLDQFIAVNPYWGWRSQPVPEAAAKLRSLTGTPLTMPRSWYREQWVSGHFTDTDLNAAVADAGDPTVGARARAVVQAPNPTEPASARMPLVTDVRDRRHGPGPGQTWRDLVTHEISQHCGSYFDQGQASWHSDDSTGLFHRWRLQQSAVHGVAWSRGTAWARAALAALPTDPTDAITAMLGDLRIPDRGREAYLTSLLLSINGWAAWCSYRRWQARLTGSDDHEIVGLLAIRLAWEWMLRSDSETAASGATVEGGPVDGAPLDGAPVDSPVGWAGWATSWSAVGELADFIAVEHRVDWVLQGAVERAYQNRLINDLSKSNGDLEPDPKVQAVFCIDVRSEVFRRSLESVTTEIHTRGFAGFFGLPISYSPVASSLTRPQLPGLLAPSLSVTETPADGSDANTMVGDRTKALAARQRWSRFRSAPSSVFSFVESMGLLYGAKLVNDSLPRTHTAEKWEHDGLDPASRNGLRPRLELVDDDPCAAAAVANRVLRGMGLIDRFASLVLVCGHGGQSANNPQAAGLDCGACGGQTGEVNARALADILNSGAVRAHLVPLGITIPDTTWFVPGLHNTTTDEVQLFETELAPRQHQARIAELRSWLTQAGGGARVERAGSLGLGHLGQQPELLARAVRERANDWSQVRPEWGLAGNAAFVVAPRSRTRHMNLAGRSFLHDYDWRTDTDLATLTLIMTAPMVVTNWINMQYYASTVDNGRYGSGNKVLHNVVGGRIGVFEGNGGDLRVGLAIQSLHDGQRLRHTPLRLSVFIEAPRSGIDTVINQNQVVNDLVGNGWLHLLRIEPTTGHVEQWTPDGWTPRRPVNTGDAGHLASAVGVE